MSRVIQWWSENLLYKVLCLALACGLAISVYNRPMQQFVVEVSVGVSGIPENKIFTAEIPPRLVLRLRGPESALLAQLRTSSNLRYVVDVSGKSDGDVITFHPSELERLLDTREVRVMDIRPSRLTVRMEDRLERVVPIHVPISGSPKAGFRHVRSALRVVPAQTKIKGPRSVVQKLNKLETRPVKLDGLDHSADFEQQLLRPDGQHIQVDLRTVRVQVTLEETLHRKTLPTVPIQLNGCRQGDTCTVFPGVVRVVLHGPKKALDQIADPPSKDFVYVTIAPEQGRGVHKLELKTGYRPAGVFAQFEPAVVMVEVAAPPLEKKLPQKIP